MKKIILSIAVALSGIISVNAQFTIGGSVNFSTGLISPAKEKDNEVSGSFSLSPTIGYRLNDKWEVGVSLTANIFDSKNAMVMTDNEGNFGELIVNESKTKEYFIGTYARYRIVKLNKFSVCGYFNVYAGKGKSDNRYLIFSGESEHTQWGATICPVGMFDLSNKITLFANLNFLSLDFSQNKIKNQQTTTKLNFLADTNNILPAIGFIYKF